MPPGPKPKPLDQLSAKSLQEIRRRRSKQGFEARQLNQKRSNQSSFDNQLRKLRKTDNYLQADEGSRRSQEKACVEDYTEVL
jgi:hypothetical protein